MTDKLVLRNEIAEVVFDYLDLGLSDKMRMATDGDFDKIAEVILTKLNARGLVDLGSTGFGEAGEME